MFKYLCNKKVFFKIALFVFCFIVNCNAWAQVVKPSLSKWDLNLGVGVNNFSVIDKNFSLLPYFGNGLGLTAAIAYQGKNIKQEISVAYIATALKNNLNNSLNQTYFSANNTSLFRLNKASQNSFKILAGPQMAIIYNSRNYDDFINNNATFEFATSLNAAIELNYNLSRIGVLLKYKIATPVFSYVQQPAYGFETYFLNIDAQNDNNIKSSGYFLGFNKFFRISNSFIIDKKLAQKHKLSLNYNLDFYKINTIREVKNFANSLTLSYGYLL